MARSNKWLVAALVLAAASTAAADEDRYEMKFSKTIPARGLPVIVDHHFGNVTIQGESGSMVNIRATIRSSDPQFGNQIRVHVDETAKGIRVRTEYPLGRRIRSAESSFSVDYLIKVPPRTPVQVENRFGAISVTGVAGPVQLTNSQGSISVKESRGPLAITNAFGSITVHDATSPTNVLRNQNGSIEVRDIDGNLDLTNRFGSVNVVSVDGNAVLRNTNGSLSVKEILRDLTVENAFADMTVSEIGGALRVTNTNGRVDIRDVIRDATITNSFGSVAAAMIGGSLAVTGQNVSVNAKEVDGSVTVRTSFSPVFLKEIGGAVDIRNNNGSIAVSELKGTVCQPVLVRTSLSAVRVAVPSNASYRVNARNANGRILSRVPVRSTSSTNDALIGVIGNGKCAMELVNSNGSITIERD
jgi:hypothetical protein